jgi:nicotinamidase-related amidase
MPDPILIVDVQRGFINEYTHHVPPRVAQLLRGGEYHPVLFTRFVNRAGGPYHRFLDWHACQGPPDTDLAPELEPFARPELTFSKPGLCGIPEELNAYLRQHGYDRVFVAGIDTDMCVLKVALDLFDRSIEPIVLTDCCASTSGLQAHLAGLAVLSRNIGALRLRDAGLSEGTMAAPPTASPSDPDGDAGRTPD